MADTRQDESTLCFPRRLQQCLVGRMRQRVSTATPKTIATFLTIFTGFGDSPFPSDLQDRSDDERPENDPRGKTKMTPMHSLPAKLRHLNPWIRCRQVSHCRSHQKQDRPAKEANRLKDISNGISRRWVPNQEYPSTKKQDREDQQQ
jgi:hypothetical protein